jgi:hypothetical protein
MFTVWTASGAHADLSYQWSGNNGMRHARAARRVQDG